MDCLPCGEVIVHVAQLIHTIPHNGPILCMQIVHPVHLLAGNARIPERYGSYLNVPWTRETGKRVQPTGIDCAGEEVPQSQDYSRDGGMV